MTEDDQMTKDRDEAREELCRAREFLNDRIKQNDGHTMTFMEKNAFMMTIRDNFLSSTAPCSHEVEAKRLLGNDTAWPLDELLEVLVDISTHLMSTHDCDCHGWERWHAAIAAGQERIAELRRAGAK